MQNAWVVQSIITEKNRKRKRESEKRTKKLIK